MNCLTLSEPLLGLVLYERVRAGLRRLVNGSCKSASPSQQQQLQQNRDAAAAVLQDLDEAGLAAFKDFSSSCRLSEAGLTSEDIRRCSKVSVHPLPGGLQQNVVVVSLIHRRQSQQQQQQQQQKRGFRTSAGALSGESQHRYTGIGKRAGSQGQAGGVTLGRIFGGQQPQSASDSSISDQSDQSSASASIQGIMRSLTRDVPLDPHSQNAVLLRLIDAYSRGIRDGVGHAGQGVDGGKADARGKISERAMSLFWIAVRLGLVVFVVFGAVTVLAARDSLSKVILTDFSMQKETSNVRFDDVRGCDTAKKELEDVVSFLKHPENFNKIGARLPRGVLLVGPPGVGKTMLAKAVAGEAEVPFYQCSGSQFDEVFVGTGAARVRRLFEEAKKAAPCVIFIDEFDSVAGKRVTTTHHPYANQTVNQLLAEMDGFTTQDGVIVLAATNRPEILDSAITRPGRFDVSVQVFLPDLAGRQSILELYFSKVATSDDVDVDRLAKMTIGFSGAQLFNVVNQAAVLAALAREPFITWAHVQNAYNKVKMGSIGNKPRTEHVNAMTAAHEAGHTIVALFTKDAPKVNHVTILPRGFSLGHTAFLPDESDQYGRRKSQLLAEIDLCMGGQAAEELLFGPDSVTIGCSDDFKRANQVVREMVGKVGMSEALGVMTVAENDSSQQTLALVDAEVKRVLDDSRERARKILREKRPELERLTAALLEFESLDSEDILRVVAGERPAKAIKSRARLTSGSASAAAAAAVTKDSSSQQHNGPGEASGCKDASWLKILLGGGGGKAGGPSSSSNPAGGPSGGEGNASSGERHPPTH